MIITDILMPKMDGFQLCREVKSDEKLKNITFIFYTASYTGPEDQKFGLDLGADRYIIKPIDPDKFLEIIGDMLLNAHKIVPAEPAIKNESEEHYLQGYSTRVFSQLEKKIDQLENMNDELIEAQKALKESEHKYYVLFNSIQEAVLFYEIGSDGISGKILEVNKAACKKTGYSHEELLQMNIYDLGKPDFREDIKSKIDEIRNKNKISFETEMMKKDRTSFPVYIKAGLIEMKGRIYGVSLVRDLTAEKESKRVEREALIDIERNLTLNATLNDAIRNPLAVISGILSIDKPIKSKEILKQIRIIDDIITELDKGSLESAKIRDFLKRHYCFGEDERD
jgi:PAS domain S-box-containing protein